MQLLGPLFGTLLALYGVLLLFVISSTMVGIWCGTKPKEIAVGFGPGLRRKFGDCLFRIGIFPVGAYTQFLGDDDELPVSDGSSPRRLSAVPILGRAAMQLIGPVSNVMIGWLLLFAAIFVPDSGIVVDLNSPHAVRPTAVPGLAIAGQATLRSQNHVLTDVALEFWRRVFFFESLEGWGGYVGWLTTCAAAARQSPGAWLTCFGAGCVALGLFQLLPIPSFNGGHLLFLAVETVMGRISERLMFAAALCGFVVLLVISLRVIYFDVTWLWRITH